MRTPVTFLAIALVAVPAAAAPRNPAAPLGLAAARAPVGQTSAQPAAGQDGAARPVLPVPGYKFIAAGILLGIAGVIFAFTQQDSTPDSN